MRSAYELEQDCLSSFSLSLGLLQLPRVRPHCCHVRLPVPRPRPGRTLGRGEHLGLVGSESAKLEADLAGVQVDDGDFCHRVIHERELPSPVMDPRLTDPARTIAR